jgi:hypothetical protein
LLTNIAVKNKEFFNKLGKNKKENDTSMDQNVSLDNQNVS